MCGINGLLGFNAATSDLLDEMSQHTRKRGPDRSHKTTIEKANLGLGHDRLVVLEASSLADQPLTDSSESKHLVYNGEIYNFRSLNENPSATSDSLELFEALCKFDVESILGSLNGMFAFAYADVNKREIVLARDKFGQKPLYYWIDQESKKFAFSSDINSILVAMKWCGRAPEISETAASEFFQLNYVGGDQTIYKGVFKVQPGELIFVKFDDVDSISLTRRKYVKVSRHKKVIAPPLQAFDGLFNEVISDHLIADVPVGCFLSGGLDSTAVAIGVVKNSVSSCKTFSVGYSDNMFDESDAAARTADMLGTDHYPVYITEDDLLEFVDSLHECFPEPFSDSSQIACFVLSKHARKQVTVALTGDGGDEIFGGYNRYVVENQFGSILRGRLVRLLAQQLIRQAQRPTTLKILQTIGSSATHMPVGDIEAKLTKLRMLLFSDDEWDFYKKVVKRRRDSIDYLNIGLRDIDFEGRCEDALLGERGWWQMRNADISSYLPDDNLQKVDRSSMYHALECRAPLLDTRLKNFADALGPAQLLLGSRGKLPLHEYISLHLPDYSRSSVKSGFSVPMKSFVFPVLYDWMVKTIDEGKNLSCSYIDRRRLIKTLDKFMHSGEGDVLALWDGVVFANFENRFYSQNE